MLSLRPIGRNAPFQKRIIEQRSALFQESLDGRTGIVSVIRASPVEPGATLRRNSACVVSCGVVRLAVCRRHSAALVPLTAARTCLGAAARTRSAVARATTNVRFALATTTLANRRCGDGIAAKITGAVCALAIEDLLRTAATAAGFTYCRVRDW